MLAKSLGAGRVDSVPVDFQGEEAKPNVPWTQSQNATTETEVLRSIKFTVDSLPGSSVIHGFVAQHTLEMTYSR